MKEKKYLSSTQVLTIFCAVMLERKNNSFTKEKLTKIIYEFKQQDEYDDLLHNIKYNSLDAYVYSRDLERSIMIFKLCGLMYHKGVESSDTLNISETLDYKHIIEKYLKYFSLMSEIVNEYLDVKKIYKKAI